MSNKADIETGRLVSTCNCGWLDRNHLEDPSACPFVGAKNPWKPFVDEKVSLVNGWCMEPTSDQLSPFVQGYRSYRAQAEARFPDGSPGFNVTYKQDMGGYGPTFGIDRSYLVRFDLTHSQKKSVALTIFMAPFSRGFDAYQANRFWRWFTDSGFSQEDLVSDLLGFHVAIGEVTQRQVLDACQPVSKAASLAVWDANGVVGNHKKKTFDPMLIDQPPSECVGQPKAFPLQFKKITPVSKGKLFVDFPGLPDDACADAPARGWRAPVLGL